MKNEIEKYKDNGNKKFLFVANMILIIIIAFLLLFRESINCDYIVLFLSICLLTILFKYKSSIFIKYFFSIFNCIFMIVGLFFCNNTNIYLHEIAKSSHYNGSFPVAIIYYIVFFCSLVFFDAFFSKRKKYYISTNTERKFDQVNKLIYPVMFLIGLLMFMLVFKNPSFKTNMDRFQYMKNYLPTWLKKMQEIYIYITPFLLIPIIIKNEKIDFKVIRKLIIILIPFLLYGLWTGNKFGMFLNVFILLLSPIVVYMAKGKLTFNSLDNLYISHNKNFNIKKNIRKMLLSSFVIFLILLLPYYILRNMNFNYYIVNRTAQQGQLWWAIYDQNKTEKWHLEELNDEFTPLVNSLKNEEIGYSYGVYKIMRITTPYTGYIAKLAIGSRYSAQGLEIAFYYMKYSGLIIHAILKALFETLTINLFIKYLFSYRVIETSILARFIVINHAIFGQGDLYLLFSWDTLLLTMMWGLLVVLHKKTNIKQRGSRINEIQN